MADPIHESSVAGSAGRHASGGLPPGASGTRRTRHVIGAVLIGVVLPAVLIGWFVGEFGAAGLLTGMLLGAVGAKIGGTRRVTALAPLIGLAGGVGAFTAYGWSWVGLLTATGLLAGAGIGFGWLPATLMVAYAATFVSPVSTVPDAVIYGVVVGLGVLYGVAIARRFGAVPVVNGDRLPLPVTLVVAVVFGAVLGGCAAIGSALGWTEPYWVAEPVLVLVLYILTGKRERIREKAIGTALGAAAAIPVAILSPSAQVLTLVGLVAFVVALTQAKTYWLMYGIYTFALILLLAAPGEVVYETEERGFQILLGIGLLVIGLIIIHVLARWLARKHPQPLPAVAPNTPIVAHPATKQDGSFD